MHPQWGQKSANRLDNEGQVSNNLVSGSVSDFGGLWRNSFGGSTWRDRPWLVPDSNQDTFGAASSGGTFCRILLTF